MIQILYEDASLLIVEKPAGIPTQPKNPPAPPLSKGGKGGFPSAGAPTLAEILAETYPELKTVGGSDTGACHRLDTDTSGLVVFARNQKTYERMREAFSKDKVEREYLALVQGTVSKGGRIDWPIGPDPKSSKKVKAYKNLKEARRHGAKGAVTKYSPLLTKEGVRGRSDLSPTLPFVKGGSSLLKITLKGGRRHQIRAHLAAIGHPVISLHASHLVFNHPHEAGLKIDVQSPPPPRSEGSKPSGDKPTPLKQ